MKQSDQSLPTFKVGDLVEANPKAWGARLPAELAGKTFKIIKVGVNGEIWLDVDIDVIARQYGRTASYWELAKNHIIKEIIKDL